MQQRRDQPVRASDYGIQASSRSVALPRQTSDAENVSESDQSSVSSKTRGCASRCSAFVLLVVGTVIALTLGLVIALVLYFRAIASDEDKIENVLETGLSETVTTFASSLASLQQVVNLAGVSFTRLPFSQGQFSEMASRILSDHPEVIIMSFGPRVEHEDRAAFEAEINAEFGVNRTIGDTANDLEPTAPGLLPVADVRPDYYPLTRSTLFPRRLQPLMFDVADPGNDPENPLLRGIQLREALKNNVPTASPTTLMVSGCPATVVLFPVYPPGLDVESIPPADRHHNSSAIMTVLATPTSFASALLVDGGATEELSFRFEELVDEATMEYQFVFGLVANGTTGTLNQDVAAMDAVTGNARFTKATTVPFFQTQWRVTGYTTTSLVDRIESSAPIVILVAVLLLTAGCITILVIVYLLLSSRAKAAQYRAELQTRLRKARIQAAREAHESTLRYACHELRNPLHAISASASFLLGDSAGLPAESVDDAASIDLACRQMMRIVNDVLDMAKLRAGVVSLIPSVINVKALMKTLKNMFQPMARSGVGFAFVVDPSVPDFVKMDELRVRQIVSNGLTNALKATNKGYVVFQVSLLKTPVNTLLFQVLDTGAGLRGADAHTLFDPMGTVDWGRQLQPEALPMLGVLIRPPPKAPESTSAPPSPSRMGGEQLRALAGSNFGLPICERLVRTMKGSVMLTESRGHTVFWAALPFEPVSQSEASRLMSGQPSAFESVSDRSSTPPLNSIVHPLHLSTSSGTPVLADASTTLSDEGSSRFVVGSGSGSGGAGRNGTRAESGTGRGGTGGGAGTGIGSPATISAAKPLSLDPLTSPSGSLSVVTLPSPSSSTARGKDTGVGGGVAAAAAADAAASATLRMSGMNVLICDDEKTNLRVGQRMLKKMGCSVVGLEDGVMVYPALMATGQLPHSLRVTQAVDARSGRTHRPFDAILLDIQMAQLNGDQVCQALRAAGFRLPIIAMTGNCSDADVSHYLSLGFDAVLAKPFDVEALKKALTRATSQHAPTADSAASVLVEVKDEAPHTSDPFAI